MKRSASGFILVFVLLMISIGMALVTVALTKVSTFTSFSMTMINRERAKQLAYGGISLAMSQLAEPDVPEKEQAEKKEQSKPGTEPGKQPPAQPEQKADPAKKLLQKIVPLLGTWQTVKLSQKEDGVSATIMFCLMSEDGKININSLYDFEKKMFVGDEDKEKGTRTAGPGQPPIDDKKQPQAAPGKLQGRVILEAVAAKLGNGIQVQDIEAFLKKRKYPLNDVTELMGIAKFETFKNAIFYDPPAEKKERRLYLTDIFTVATSQAGVNPWVFSDSVRALFGLPRVSGEKTKQLPEQTIKGMKLNANWATEWDKVLKPWYERDYASLPKPLMPLLAQKSDLSTFSVLVHATVAKVTVRVYAILERIPGSSDKEPTRVIIKQIFAL